MERYPIVTELIKNIDLDNYAAFKKCVRGVAEITAYDEYNIPFLWNEMLSAVLNSCTLSPKYDTKQTISNWIEAAFMWNAEMYAPLAKDGFYPFPVSGDYYDFGFSRELEYLSHVENDSIRTYIKTIALFEILRYYIRNEKIGSTCFDEHDMWGIALEVWPVDIDWGFYDVSFDGHNFSYDTSHQSLKLDEILEDKRYKNILSDGNRYEIPAYEFAVGSVIDEDGGMYSADGRIFLRSKNKYLNSYRIKDVTRIICSAGFPHESELIHIAIPESVVYIESSSFQSCEYLRTIEFEGNGLEVIGAYAFSQFEPSLWRFSIPESVIEIDEGAFSGSCVETFYVGKNVVRLTGGNEEYSDTQFYSIGSSSTRRIVVHEDNPYFTSVEGMLFSKDKKVLYACPGGINNDLNIDTVSVPYGTEELYPSCCDAPKLKTLILPETIKKLGKEFIWTNVEELILYSSVPPIIESDREFEQLVVRVPKESVKLYRNDENWSKLKCKCIISIDESVPHSPTKEELSALKLWTMGAGNSAKRFKGENPIPVKTVVATKDSWTILPMPEQYITIPVGVVLPDNAMECVKYGHIPDAMENHWFMYCDDSTIRYYRSWTGFCIYVARYEKVDEGYKIIDLTVNRYPEQYKCDDDKHDLALFMALLTEEYGGDASQYWNAAF